MNTHAGTGRVTFVGAGPGAADLITVRGATALAGADIVVWAASLVAPEMLAHARAGAQIIDSAELTLESTVDIYRRAAAEGLHVVRLHSGDPALWGAIQEQIEQVTELGLRVEVVPGVSAYAALAATIGRELTVPEVAQSVILTRLEGGKTPMPPGETIRGFAAHGTTMAVFLSAARSRQLADELLAGGYPADTPVVLGYRVTWPDEVVLHCTVGTLVATVREHKFWKHTLFLIGPGLAHAGTRSHLYHPGHFHGFRKADRAARVVLKGGGHAE
ncbi:MAG TPA: precorrin-4 C(11)-methyltransferase [Pilimelia sp.]|nr:precorrin-4 C(11)-methyltransferase [Pilimelia sp.]